MLNYVASGRKERVKDRQRDLREDGCYTIL